MRKLWSLPVITVYFYAIATLTQYGYNSYFNIPSNFIEVSIRSNIIYFFQLFQVGESIAGLMRWWMWIVVIVTAVIVLFLCFSHHLWQKFFIFIATIFLFLSLRGSFNFGSLLAASTSTFLVPQSDCIGLSQDQKYIVPIIYDSKAILIPVDETTKKMSGGFLVKDISSLSCELQNQNIGKIIK